MQCPCSEAGNGAIAPALAGWRNTVHSIRTDIVSWTARQSKHAPVAYPFITMLLCLEDDSAFSSYVDTLMDHLQRQLKARPDVIIDDGLLNARRALSWPFWRCACRLN